MDWFPVSVIISETRSLERKKQQLVKAKDVKECSLRQSRSSMNGMSGGMSGEDKTEIRQRKDEKGKKEYGDPGLVTFCNHVQAAQIKRRKVSVLDVGEMAVIEKAIRLSRRCISKV